MRGEVWHDVGRCHRHGLKGTSGVAVNEGNDPRNCRAEAAGARHSSWRFVPYLGDKAGVRRSRRARSPSPVEERPEAAAGV